MLKKRNFATQKYLGLIMQVNSLKASTTTIALKKKIAEITHLGKKTFK